MRFLICQGMTFAICMIKYRLEAKSRKYCSSDTQIKMIFEQFFGGTELENGFEKKQTFCNIFATSLNSLCSISRRSETLFVEGANLYDDFCRRFAFLYHGPVA